MTMTIKTTSWAAGRAFQATAWRQAVAAALILTGLTAPAEAQRDSIPWTYATLFEWSEAGVDTTQYRTVEDCLEAIERTLQRAERHQWLSTGLWRDTLPPDDPRFGPSLLASSGFNHGYAGAVRLEPLPDTVVATARWCTQRITPAATLRDGGQFTDLLKAYLAANRDAEVTALVTQRLAALPAADTARRRALEDTVLGVYKAVQPVRRQAGEALLERRLGAAGVSGSERVLVLGRLFDLAHLVGDTAAVRARAAQIMAAWEPVPAAEREAIERGAAKRPPDARALEILNALHAARRVPHRAALLDSLRRGGAAYVRAEQVLIQGKSAPTATGDTAPPLTAGIWFRREPGETARPRRGRVELVAVLPAGFTGGLCGGTNNVYTAEWQAGRINEGCVQTFATLRRLARRFPELGITVLASTGGTLAQRAFPDPAAEAELIRQWLHDVEGLPGALAVRVNPISRRPAPDRRVLRGQQKSSTRPTPPKDYSGLSLVGRDGILIRLDYGEKNTAEMIAAALEQPK